MCWLILKKKKKKKKIIIQCVTNHILISYIPIINGEYDGGCSGVLSGLCPHLYGQSSVFYICLFAVPPGHIHSLCLWSITSNSTCISSDTALLQLPEYSLVFWRDLWKITTLFKGCYLTSDRSQSSRLSAWQTNGPVDNEKSSERPGAATFESRWVGGDEAEFILCCLTC